jgi:hypothetical protein
MLELLLWILGGALVGSLVGVYRCADISRALPRFGHAGHIGICVVVGAVAGALLFLGLASSFYNLNPFSN